LATLTVELVEIDESSFDAGAVLNVLNANQHAFRFESLSGDFHGRIRDALSDQNPVLTSKIFATVRDHTPLGFHPYVVTTFVRQIDGESLRRLFSSTEEREGGFTGLAAVSCYQVDELLKGIPKDLYVAFQLLSIAIRFAVGRPMLHDGRPECVFHRRIQKDYIHAALLAGRLCDVCSDKLKDKFDERQRQSVRALLNVISDISGAADAAAAWRTEVARVAGASSQPPITLTPQPPAPAPAPAIVPVPTVSPTAGPPVSTSPAAGPPVVNRAAGVPEAPQEPAANRTAVSAVEPTGPRATSPTARTGSRPRFRRSSYERRICR
jgi:hypothetical protein